MDFLIGGIMDSTAIVIIVIVLVVLIAGILLFLSRRQTTEERPAPTAPSMSRQKQPTSTGTFPKPAGPPPSLESEKRAGKGLFDEQPSAVPSPSFGSPGTRAPPPPPPAQAPVEQPTPSPARSAPPPPASTPAPRPAASTPPTGVPIPMAPPPSDVLLSSD